MEIIEKLKKTVKSNAKIATVPAGSATSGAKIEGVSYEISTGTEAPRPQSTEQTPPSAS